MSENVSKVYRLPGFELCRDDRPTEPAPPSVVSEDPAFASGVLSPDIDQRTLLRELQEMYFDKN